MLTTAEALQFRRAEAADAAAIQALARQYRVYQPSAGDEVWLAATARKIIAYIAWRSVADEAELLGLAVAESHRRRGIAQHLHHLSAPAAHCFLEVRASNQAAQAFYQRLGYQFCGRRKNYYQQPCEDACLMQCHRAQLEF